MRMSKSMKQRDECSKYLETDPKQVFKNKHINTRIATESPNLSSFNLNKSKIFCQNNVLFAMFQNVVQSYKKNQPLPQLYKIKKYHHYRLINNHQSKQIRQQDNLLLKQKNNYLTTQNQQLKTKIHSLQTQLFHLSKSISVQSQNKSSLSILSTHNRSKSIEYNSYKNIIKTLKKQISLLKQQNNKIKFTSKFMKINQLQCQRQQILIETYRLRTMLQNHFNKKYSAKMKQSNIYGIQQKYQNLTEKTANIIKQNTNLRTKLKSVSQTSKKYQKIHENQKNLNQMLFNAKKLIKQKQVEIYNLKTQSTFTSNKLQPPSIITLRPKTQKQFQSPSQQLSSTSPSKRTPSKSAQKYRKTSYPHQSLLHPCKNCQKYQQQITTLKQQIKSITQLLNQTKYQTNHLTYFQSHSKQQISYPSQSEINQLKRFLTYRFKAHHLSLSQSQKYLINSQITDNLVNQTISISQLVQNLVAQPFSILTDRYLEVCILFLFYSQQSKKPTNKLPIKLTIDQHKSLPKSTILQNFTSLIPPYQHLPQQKQQQLFIQISQLITTYHQHILTALTNKSNGQGTISQHQFINFFNQIQLDQQFTQFILTQIILESLDLEHLNFYAIFEIFYLPSQNLPFQKQGSAHYAKNKFQICHNQIVKEQDQQYQQSKSHLDAKQKTLSRHQQPQHLSQQQQQLINLHTQRSQNPPQQPHPLSKLSLPKPSTTSMKNIQLPHHHQQKLSPYLQSHHNQSHTNKQFFKKTSTNNSILSSAQQHQSHFYQELQPFQKQYLEDDYYEKFD